MYILNTQIIEISIRQTSETCQVLQMCFFFRYIVCSLVHYENWKHNNVETRIQQRTGTLILRSLRRCAI